VTIPYDTAPTTFDGLLESSRAQAALLAQRPLDYDEFVLFTSEACADLCRVIADLRGRVERIEEWVRDPLA